MSVTMVNKLICCFYLFVACSSALNISHSCDVDSSSNACLLNELKSLKAEVQSLKQEQHPLQTEVQSLKQELQTLKTQGQACPAVAFRAELHNDINNPSKGYHFVYDDVKLNLGNGYNSHHGTFVAPTSGTYYLSYHISYSPGNTSSLIRIVMKRNGDIVAHSMSAYVSYWTMDTYTNIINLNVGDDVWIEVLYTNFPFRIPGDTYIGPHSVFEGFLINC